MKILIVDDKEDHRYLLEALFKGNNHSTVSSSNGSEAIDQLSKTEFDLIISDILMPVMDGFELCRRVKTDAKLRNIPFIFYTATYTGPKDEEFALKIGADKFIVTPCEPEVFMEAVREVVKNKTNANSFVSVETQEEVILKLYNERLVRKLEQKMLQLEKETKELTETKEVLRKSEEKYRRLHESMMDGFLYIEMDGLIMETNESFRNMIGYTKEELSHLTYNGITPMKWHEFEENVIREQILKKGYSDVYEKEMI